MGHHLVVMAVGAVGKEDSLRLEQTQPHIAQGLAILLFAISFCE